MEEQMKEMDFPLNPNLALPVTGENNSESDTDQESENESENEEFELPKRNPIPRKSKDLKLLSLKDIAAQALLKNKNVLVIIAAELLFPLKYEEYKTMVPISDQLILPGSSEPIDLIASPEISKVKGHLRGYFIDLIHSGTRLRANATSRDVLMGRASAFHYIAEEGSTALKLTHIVDRCDMMSEDISRVRFFFYINMTRSMVRVRFKMHPL